MLKSTILKLLLIIFLINQTHAKHAGCNDTFQFLDFEASECVSNCGASKFKDSDNSICYSKCPKDLPYYNDNNECVSTCGDKYVLLTENKCVDNCSGNF